MITKTTPKEMYAAMRKETVACNLCTGSRLLPVMDTDRYGMGLTTVLCETCGLMFTNPRPVQDEMNDFYRDVYRQFYTGTTNVERDYVKESSRYVRAERLFRFIEPELRRRGGSSPTVLDCGCGSGTILHVFKTHFPQARLYGVEPDVHFARHAGEKTGARVWDQDVDSFAEAQASAVGRFDVLILNHVLEHLYNPVDKLMRLREFITDKGLLLVEVPDILSDEWRDPLKIFHIAHITHFTVPTLKHAFARAGFEIIREARENRVMTFLCRKKSATGVDVPLLSEGDRWKLIGTLGRMRSKIRGESTPPAYMRPILLARSLAKKTVIKTAGIVRRAKRVLSRFGNESALTGLLRGRRVWIVGSGPSTAELETIPDDVTLLTCNGGLKLLADRGLHRRVDLLFCAKGKMERNRTIERLIEQTHARILMIDDPGFIRNRPNLRGRYDALLFGDETDNYYLKRLIGKEAAASIRIENRACTSADLLLLQLALFFGAAEIGLIGIDFGDRGYFGEVKDRDDRPLDVDERFIRIVTAHTQNLLSLSKKSPLAAYLPSRKCHEDG